MPIFIDLIAQSYLQYVIDGDKEIAQFYYQEFYKVREGSNNKIIFSKKQFYKKLISEIDSLIENHYIIENKRNKPNSYQYTEYDEYENYLVQELIDQEEEEMARQQGEEEEYQEALREEEYNSRVYGDPVNQVFFKRPKAFSWEKCNDAEKLIDAINNKNVILKDPITIIQPSETISDKPVVLRRSNLEFLKTEAERAKIAKNIDELDTIPDPLSINIENTQVLPEELTVREIIKYFNSTEKQGWEFAFIEEQDFNDFADLLALNLEQKSVTLPEKIFKLKKRTKTKVSAILKTIHDEISNVDTLKGNTEYFDIIKLLSLFSDMNNDEIYKSLTK